MTSLRAHRLAAAALAGLLLLTACGGDDDDSSSDDAAEATTSTTEVDVIGEVSTAYTSFFGSAGDLTRLEDGGSFTAADVEALRAVAAGGTISATVASVTALSDEECASSTVTAPCAAVVYDILVDGAAVLEGSQGFAVFQDGTWKVAKGTFCTLADLAGARPAACP